VNGKFWLQIAKNNTHSIIGRNFFKTLKKNTFKGGGGGDLENHKFL
jgi:hypothetical protein